MTTENTAGLQLAQANVASHLPKSKRRPLSKAKKRRFEAQRQLNWYLDTVLNIAVIINCILFFFGIMPPLILIIFAPKFFAKVIEAVVDIKTALYSETLSKKMRNLFILRACMSLILNLLNLGLSVVLALAPVIGLTAFLAGTILSPITLGLAIMACGLYLLMTTKGVFDAIRELIQLKHTADANDKDYIMSSTKLTVCLTASIGLALIILGLSFALAACFCPPLAGLFAAITAGMVLAACSTFVVSNALQKIWPTIYNLFKPAVDFFRSKPRLTTEMPVLAPPTRMVIRTTEAKERANIEKWKAHARKSGFYRFGGQGAAYQLLPQEDVDSLQHSPSSIMLAKK